MKISIEQLVKAAADGNPTTLRARLKLGVPPIEVMTALDGAVVRRRFPMGASPTRPALQPEATGAVIEVTKWLKPSGSVSRIGEPRLPLWVNNGPPAPCPFTSAVGG